MWIFHWYLTHSLPPVNPRHVVWYKTKQVWLSILEFSFKSPLVKKKMNIILKKYKEWNILGQTPFWHLPDTIHTPSTHLPDTFLTPSRHMGPFSPVEIRWRFLLLLLFWQEKNRFNSYSNKLKQICDPRKPWAISLSLNRKSIYRVCFFKIEPEKNWLTNFL